MGTFFATFLTLFFTIDAFGIIPSYLSLLKRTHPSKRRWVALRELFFALIIMIIFHYLGRTLLDLLELDVATVEIAAGIVLFIISIRLIFKHEEDPENLWGEKPPFIVPIATPLIAGPSVLAIIMIYSQRFTSDLFILLAVFAAWLLSFIILLFARSIYRFVGDKGLIACEKLMGLIVALIAVQTFLQGVEDLKLVT